LLNASFGVHRVIRRWRRNLRRRPSLAQQPHRPLLDGARGRLRTAAAAAHLLPTFVTRRHPVAEVPVVRPYPTTQPGFLGRIGHERVCALVVAGVVGVATVLSIAPTPRQVEAPTVASIERIPTGPVGGPRGDGSAPRLVAGGAFGVERVAGVDDMAYAPAPAEEFRDVGAVAGAVGFAPAAKEETVSGPFLDDGTLLKPVSVNTTVPDAKDMLRKHKVKAGETLASISAKYKVDKATIYWASKLTSQRVRPGQKLTIPPVNGLLVKVRSTDSLTSLAKKYKIKADAILEANKLEDPNLVMGQVLILPGAKGDPMPKLPKPKASRSGSSGGAAPAEYRGGRFSWPVAGGDLSQGYHYGHYGIDIAADSGTPVKAAAGGKVTFAGWKSNGGGYQVWIAHGSGLYTTYNHMSSITVGTGQSVGRGQQVGRVGSTGYATGPHLHFEVWRGAIWNGGQRVNPLSYL
jgi:murein DD-endopeptidase MepM/ murein hydrolase activator NlpD